MAKINNEEELEQEAFIKFINYQFPSLLYCASGGGARMSMKQAVKMKKTGYVAGFPDVFIYEPRREFKGLAIEMKKRKGGRVEPNQLVWQRELTKRGYKSVICRGFEEARAELIDYLQDPNNIPF